MPSLVNIVMPVYNRPTHTKQAISSLFENTDNDLFSLFVVDDCSDKETNQLLRDLQKTYKFGILVNDGNVGPGESRNRACEILYKTQQTKQYLYFSDNDVYFKPRWLATLLDVYTVVSKQLVGLLGASCHPYLQSQHAILTTITHPETGELMKVALKDAVSGYSHLITWELWHRFKPFDTQLGLAKKTGRSDDWAFCRKLVDAGFLVGSCLPELIIPTGETDSYGDDAVGKNDGVFKKYSDIYIG